MRRDNSTPLVAYTLANLARQLLAEVLYPLLLSLFFSSFKHARRNKSKGIGAASFDTFDSDWFLCSLSWYHTIPSVGFAYRSGFRARKLLWQCLLQKGFPLANYLLLPCHGVLNSLGSFFVPAVAPAVSNVVFIVIVLFFYKKYGISVLPIAVLAGGVSQFCVQWIWSAWKVFVLYPTKINRADD